MKRFGIVICSRLDSSRIPGKVLVDINGRTLLEHLIRRIMPAGVPICIAVPGEDLATYQRALNLFTFNPHCVVLMTGPKADPLARMREAAGLMELDAVIRINHDKIFVDAADLVRCMKIFECSSLDYLYSSSFVPGTGFEIISRAALEKAADRFQNVEHISYAIQAVTDRKTDVGAGHEAGRHRLLIDYPEDLFLVTQVMKHLGNDCTLRQVFAFLDRNPALSRMNRLPILTVYTCALNAERWLPDAMASVAEQKGFQEFEYILVDDGSTDQTPDVMKGFCALYKNAFYFRNEKNLGLASSSNVALSHARGKFILRLDADDLLLHDATLMHLVRAIEASTFDVIYPDHYLGSMQTIEKGYVNHHVGGTIFRTSAVNHVKFTDGLRGLEGYDFFERAKTQLRIGYYEKPTFFYRQHKGSLSKSDPAARAAIKKEIDERVHEQSRVE